MELYNLYSSGNIRMIKSSRMRWGGKRACTGDMGNANKIS
jgi:hypothetical protein